MPDNVCHDAGPAKTSDLIRSISHDIHTETISVDAIVNKLGRRSYGGLFILLAGVGIVPGMSLFGGLAMIIPAIQLLLGFEAPVLPGFIRRRALHTAKVIQVIERVVPWIERVEKFVRPRWPALTVPPLPNVTGVVILGLACVIMLPLPFSNMPPAIAVIFLALGMLERDGAAIAAGLAVSVFAFVTGVVVVKASLHTLLPVIHGFFD
ncbi:MAG: exopolysaccharide biosynthesis protein [Alphaproteobacteria bacterium]